MIKDLRRRGQALVMVTFALVAMIGILGLAVDFSFAYFLEKTMQSAADSAALAAVQKAREVAGGSSAITCSTANCYPAATACTSITSGTARAGCQYAAQNGFTAAEVTIQANAAASMTADVACTPSVKHPPAAGCVSVLYYATARISRRVPQLFSAILGRSEGTVSSRSTAAIAETTIVGSLILLNRNNDMPGVSDPPNGSNLNISGGGDVTVPGGIMLSSISTTAGRIQGSGTVVSPFTNARAANVIGGSQASHWSCAAGGAYCPPQVVADGEMFTDPFDLKSKNGDIGGQPPIYGPGESVGNDILRPVIGGVLTTSICPGGTCPPGIYYAVAKDSGAGTLYHPSGLPITTGNNTTFNFGGGGVFNRYMFIGGLVLSSGTSTSMAAGRYIFAGVLNAGDSVFETNNGVNLTGGNGSDPGRLFIFTDFRTGAQRNAPVIPGSTPQDVDSYAGQMEQIGNAIHTACGFCDWNANPWSSIGLRHGSVNVKGGNNNATNVNLQGLQDTAGLPAELKPYGSVLMWQDQHNSYVWYDQNGRLDPACGGQNSPCHNTPDSANAPRLTIGAAQHAYSLRGAIYQPRGAWTSLQGNGNYAGPLQIITGAMTLGGGPVVTLTSTSDPISTFRAALVE